MIAVGSVTLLLAAFSASVAACAFVFSVYKQTQDQKMLARGRASTAWGGYLKMAFENPDLTETPGENAIDPIRFEQYEYYVYRLLYASEEVMNYAPNDGYWLIEIKEQIAFHKSYLLQQGEGYIDAFRPKMAALIREVAIDA